MFDFIRNLIDSMNILYLYLVYLIENDTNSISVEEWETKCRETFNITRERCLVNHVDKLQNIPNLSFFNNKSKDIQFIQNSVTKEEVLFGFVTIIFIWFVIVIISVFFIVIVSLIITDISLKNRNSDDTNNRNIQTVINYDLEKQ